MHCLLNLLLILITLILKEVKHDPNTLEKIEKRKYSHKFNKTRFLFQLFFLLNYNSVFVDLFYGFSVWA